VRAEGIDVPELEVLVVWPEPDLYVDQLSAAFPQLRIRGAVDWASAPNDLAGTAILLSHGRGLTPERLAAMPSLSWLQVLMSGTEHLADVRAARPELLITSCSGIHGPQMTESALLHMLTLSRFSALTPRVRVEREWAATGPMTALEDKTVVVVGTGTTGLRLARVCRLLDMTVWAVTRTPREIDGVERCFARDELIEAASGADYIVLAMPVQDDTRGWIGREVFAAMKPTAFLVNLARGAVVDEPALIDALRAGEIAGAGLDVFAVEPLPVDSPLWGMENVFITPHIAGRSDRYNAQALEVVDDNLRRFLAGDRDQLRNLVSG
jgi:phosphoglycerate dehydrogenase-like enzyme